MDKSKDLQDLGRGSSDKRSEALRKYHLIEPFLRKEKYIGFCYGQAGVGKSMSARHFSSWDIIDKDIQQSVPFCVGLEPTLDMKDCHTIVYTPEMGLIPQNQLKTI